MEKRNRFAIGRLTEELFISYLKKGNIKYKNSSDDENINAKIDFYLYFDDDRVITVDVKSRSEYDTGDIVNLSYIARDGKPGTLQLSNAAYFAVHGYYKNQARFYFIKKEVLFDYLRTKQPIKGNKLSQYYQVDMDWISKHWSFFINENGFLLNTNIAKYK